MTVAETIRWVLDGPLQSASRWFQGSAGRPGAGLNPHTGWQGDDHPNACLVFLPRRASSPGYFRFNVGYFSLLHQHLPPHDCPVLNSVPFQLGCLVAFNNTASSFEDIRLLLKTALHDAEERGL